MVQSAATTVTGYLDRLPPDRRKTISAVRKVIRANLPTGFKEATGYGMICYSVPLKTYPRSLESFVATYEASRKKRR